MKGHATVLIFIFSVSWSYCQVDSLAVKSIEGITDKMLELISGDIGEVRDWDEYRMLFTPTAQKMSARKNRQGKIQIRSQNLEEFIRSIGPLYARDGFEEYKIGLEINEFNGIANVFQSFYCRNLLGSYEARGVNSYQLMFADDRWWIASDMFTNETKDMPLPNDLLFEKYRKN